MKVGKKFNHHYFLEFDVIYVELSIVTLFLLYYSSRLVLFLHMNSFEKKRNTLTVWSMLYYFIPGSIEYHFLKLSMQNSSDTNICELLCVIAVIVFSLILTPFLHFAYVFYCCYKQSRSHYYTSEDFPWFVPMSVIEIFESGPQCNKLSKFP